MQIYRAILVNNRMIIKKEGVVKYNLKYDQKKGSAVFKQGKVNRKIPSTKIDTYQPIKYLNTLLMVFTPYVEIDEKRMGAAFGYEMLLRFNDAYQVLREDFRVIEESIHNLEQDYLKHESNR